MDEDKGPNNLDIYVLPLISCALNMRTSILYEFDGFLSSPKRARNKRNEISQSELAKTDTDEPCASSS